MVVRPTLGDTLLVIRGEYALIRRDIEDARRWLLGPAERGSIEAARGMAETYDPVWLVRNGVTPWQSFADPERSIDWYKRAAEDGDTDPTNRYLQAKQ
jgi:TPR repeat protein